MFGGQSRFPVKFGCVPRRSMLFEKVIKHQERLGLPVPSLSESELASSMMFIGVPPGRVVLQKAMQISEHHHKVVPRLVFSRRSI
jgi:hypothetical protein